MNNNCYTFSLWGYTAYDGRIYFRNSLPGIILNLAYDVIIIKWLWIEIEINRNKITKIERKMCGFKIILEKHKYKYVRISKIIGKNNIHMAMLNCKYPINAQQGDAPEPDSRRSCFSAATSRPGDL